MENIWWKEPMRVLQYNLQVRDTPGMDAEKLPGKRKRWLLMLLS